VTAFSGTGAVVVGALLLVGGCSITLPGTTTGSGSVRTETRTASGFTAVELAGLGNVQLQQSGTESLTVTAEDNLLPLLTTEVVDKTLKLGVKDGARVDSTQPITYAVTARDLTGIDIAGSGSLTATQVKTPSLRIRVAGSGSVTAAGSADAQDVQMAGSGAYRGSGLTSTTAKVNSAGSGTAELAVSGQLDVTILGSGTVTYTGSPTVTQSIMGSGSLQKK
jgi:Putative auto-transporter adhesin, head GIN domain